MIRSGRFLPLILLSTLAAGCGSGDELPRQAVSGTVTFGGKPLAQGNIHFTPADPTMTNPVMGGAPIEDGQYSIPQEVGLVPGKYNVSISSASGEIATDEAPGSARSLPKEAIPAKYNTNSTLTADIKEGSNTVNFNLEK